MLIRVDAGVINVSLGDNPSHLLTGPAGGTATVWNTWSPLGGTLLDAKGNPTAVEVVAGGEGTYGDWWCDMVLLSGGIATSDQEQKPLEVRGLNPNAKYDLYLACARGGRNANTRFIPVGANSSVAPLQADNRTARNGSSWVKGENYVLFQDLSPDSEGTVAFTFEGDGTYGILNGLQIVEVGESVATFAQWASDSAQGLTPGFNDDPLDDADEDGIVNLHEFVMNGDPLIPLSVVQPRLLKNGSRWIFEYDRRDSSRPPGSNQVVQYSSDLLNWTTVPIPAVTSGTVDISDQGTTDRVSVTIGDTGTQLFMRLGVTE